MRRGPCAELWRAPKGDAPPLTGARAATSTASPFAELQAPECVPLTTGPHPACKEMRQGLCVAHARARLVWYGEFRQGAVGAPAQCFRAPGSQYPSPSEAFLTVDKHSFFHVRLVQ
jgi:hypothetical protein